MLLFLQVLIQTKQRQMVGSSYSGTAPKIRFGDNI
jgi:hypothetical protein